MSHILKLPTESSKGVISFTSQEERFLRKINNKLISKLKEKWIILMHPNAWNHNYNDDDFFDGFLSSNQILKLKSGDTSKIFDLCCMNFSPSYFASNQLKNKVYDVMAISRFQKEKNIIGFFNVVREVFNISKNINIILVVTVPGMRPFAVNKLRSIYKRIFSREEQKKFELISIDYNGSMALDRKTLSIIYNSSKIYLSTHTKEVGGRVMAYARAASLPIISNTTIMESAKIKHRKNPYFYVGESAIEHAKNILKALDDLDDKKNTEKLNKASKDFLENYTFPKLKKLLIDKFNLDDNQWQLNHDLEIKIARHSLGFDSAETYFFNIEDLINFLTKNDKIEDFDEDSFNIELLNSSSVLIKYLKKLKYKYYLLRHKFRGYIYKILISLKFKKKFSGP